MATKTYKLATSFLDANGKAVNMTFNYSLIEPDAEDVKGLMDAIIANGSIYKNVPVSKKSAYVVERKQTDYAIE